MLQMNLLENIVSKKHQIFFLKVLKLFLISIFLLCSVYIYFASFGNERISLFELNDLQTGEAIKIQICDDLVINNSKFNPSESKNISISYSYKFLDLIPDFDNFLCIGKVIEIWDSQDDPESFHFLIAENKKVFNTLNLFINGLFIFFILFYYLFKIKSKSIFFYTQFLLLYFNFTLRYFFTKGLAFSFYEDIALTLTTFFLMTIPFYSKNKKVFLFGVLFFITLNYDFFGLYVVTYLILNKFEDSLNNFENKIFTYTPILFLLLRFIASTSKELNVLWSKLFQNFYLGYSRFVDLQADFYILKCNSGSAPPNYRIKFGDAVNVCTETIGYGPIRKLIPIFGDVWNTVLITIFILFIFLLVQYRDLIKRNPENVFILTLLFLSPPVNLLIHLANPDIFYFVFMYFVLKKYEKNPLLMSLTIYIFTLWKVHAIGILFGLIIKSLVSKDYKIFRINFLSIFLTIFTYILDIYFTEPLTIPGSPDERWGYGILHDALQLTKFTNFNNNTHFILFTLLLWIIILYGVYKFSSDSIDNTNNFNLSYEIYGYSFWFFLTFIFQNQSYRLPLFLVLFFWIYKECGSELKYLVILALFFNPVFSNEYIAFEKLSLLLNRLGIYFIFIYLLSIFFADFYNNFLKKYLEIGFLNKIYQK